MCEHHKLNSVGYLKEGNGVGRWGVTGDLGGFRREVWVEDDQNTLYVCIKFIPE